MENNQNPRSEYENEPKVAHPNLKPSDDEQV